MKIVNVHEAKTNLSHLLSEVEHGKEVTIARSGVPVARLVAIQGKINRQPGLLVAKAGWESFVYDPSLFAPMTDEELRKEGWE
ncbi:MAG TPA: type II toxin-antitoxin system prevent-host-death family antitoxin [Acetobacteraceae bacterium]|jgi:prevent-host-death family protein